MLTFEMIIVFLGLIGMVTALVLDKMRPGMILFSVTVLFLCFGILTPKEMLEGFSNKGMITVALLFLISEGVRQSGALGQLIKKLLPQEKTTVMKAQARMLPAISFVSAFLNNTPVVVIFAPIIKRWAESVRIPATKFLIPLSYATILGGMCTLIGTSTNLVVDGMILDAGYKGFGMFELGRVGIFIALAGIVYLLFFSSRLLPEVRKDTVGDEHGEADASSFHRVEAVIGARFPGINKRVGDFNFVRHYGAEVKEIKRSGVSIVENLSRVKFHEGDTLVLWADDSFISTWGDSSVFVLLANGKDTEPKAGRKKRWFALTLLVLMIVGATVGELPFMEELLPGIDLDMFFFAAVTTVIMAWTKLFPARKYTKYISWDILITIACAFAISRAMVNSGVADIIAHGIIDMSDDYSPHVLLAVLFIITNLFTELITNNAAAALAFPLALSLSNQLGVSPMPFFVVICIAASASFSTPIGYQMGQRGVMLWLTGLSGSGKSTIAIALERELHKRGLLCRILDGDNIRSGINNNLGFSAEDRVENIRRIAEIGKLFVDTGIITIAAFISPGNELRQMAARIIGIEDFLEIYVSTPLVECEKRDVKGLYAKARRGEIKNFTGISAPFEAPEHPALSLDTSKLSLEESVNTLLELVLPIVGKKGEKI